jgi:hypothetical protein
MSDFPSKNTDPFSSSSSTPFAGRDTQRDVANPAQSSVEAAKDQASQIVGAAKTVAGQAGDRLQEKANDQKGAGADYVGRFADAMSRAASAFDSEIPVVARYMRSAASQVEGASDAMRTGDFNDLVHSAQSFARRQPTVFLGFAVLAGFGVVRFLKSSSTPSGGADATPPASRFESNRGQPSA